MIPFVYDTARVLRIIGEDGKAKNIPVNGAEAKEKTDKIFDLTIGKYDLIMSVGPSYQTQRQEEQAALIDFSGVLTDEQRAVTADLIADASDWHGKDKLSKRLKKLLPQNLLDEDEKELQKPQPKSQAEIENEAMLKARAAAEQEGLEIDNQIKKAEFKKAKAEAAAAEAEAAIKEAEAVKVGAKFKPKPMSENA